MANEDQLLSKKSVSHVRFSILSYISPVPSILPYLPRVPRPDRIAPNLTDIARFIKTLFVRQGFVDRLVDHRIAHQIIVEQVREGGIEPVNPTLRLLPDLVRVVL